MWCGQYLDYKNCLWRRSLINNLIEQCTNVVDMEISNSKNYEECPSCNVYVALFILFLVLLDIVLGSVSRGI